MATALELGSQPGTNGLRGDPGVHQGGVQAREIPYVHDLEAPGGAHHGLTQEGRHRVVTAAEPRVVGAHQGRWVAGAQRGAGGLEIANAYSERNDPAEQLARFEEQVRRRAGGDEEALFFISFLIFSELTDRSHEQYC